MEFPSSPDDLSLHIPSPEGSDQSSPNEASQVSLNANQVAALGCLACLTTDGQYPSGNILKNIADCSGTTLPSATYSVKYLVKHGLATAAERQDKPASGQQSASKHAYGVTTSGIARLPERWQPCPDDAAHKNPLVHLSGRQQKVANCVGCLEQRGEEPTGKNIAACLGIKTNSITSDLKKMAVDGLLKPIGDSKRPNGSAYSDTIAYAATAKVIKFRQPPQRDCTFANTVVERTAGLLTPAQQQMLGCIACIAQKSTSPYGAEKAAVEACGGLSADSRYGKKLQKLGLIEQHAGFVKAGGNNPRRIFYSLTDDAKAIVEAIPRKEPCQAPESSNLEPLHITDAIKRCLDCIWSRQVSNEAELGVSAVMISACTGISRHLAGRTLNTLSQHGELTKATVSSDEIKKRQQTTMAFTPSSELTPLATTEACGLNLYAPVPERYLEPVAFGKIPRFERPNSNEDSGVVDFIQTKKFHSLLSKEEEHALGTIIQGASSEQERAEAVATFVEHNVKLALWYTANKTNFESLFLGFDDRVQAALLGIEEAARHFNPAFDVRFSSYATYWMKQRVQRTAAARIGISVQKFTRIPTTYYKAVDFKTQHGRNPTILELALACDLAPKDIIGVIDARAHLKRHPLSLDHIIYSQDDRNRRFGDTTLQTLVGFEQDDFESVEIFEAVRKMAPHLNGYEKAALGNIVGYHKLPRKEIATMFGVKPHTVQAAEGRVNALLRHPYFGVGVSSRSREWQLDAACATTNTSSVVEARWSSGEVSPEVARLCGFCPVRKECLVETFKGDSPVPAGIWAGFTPAELRTYYRRSRSTRVTKKRAPETSIAHS